MIILMYLLQLEPEMTFYPFFTNYTLNLFALMQAFYVKVAKIYFLQSKCKKRPIGFSLKRGEILWLDATKYTYCYTRN